jgi:glycine/D-amino acid oxidase-like deaminating enzyme
MNQAGSRVLIVGAGIFGVTAALALCRRGYSVSLLDMGPLPHPLAASTDISKVIRMDYGSDEDYTAWMEEAMEGWRRWNRDLFTATGPLFHESGVTSLSRAPLRKGGFEYESYELLRRRGHHPERLSASDIRRRFPAWNAEVFVDGYYNPEGGYAESGKVVSRLLELAEQAGVALLSGPENRIERLLTDSTPAAVCGVITAGGQLLRADLVVLTVGAWTPHLLPETASYLRSSAQPVFHLRPQNPSLYEAARFPTFFADIANSGYYGFPLSREGVVKIANHGAGQPMHPESPQRLVSAAQIAELRTFLRMAFPELVDAPIVYTRICLYSDTWDEHLWIARDPDRPGLLLATGDSGHAFKFAPVLGDLIADALEGRTSGRTGHLLHKFRHRPDLRPQRGEEAARYHG